MTLTLASVSSGSADTPDIRASRLTDNLVSDANKMARAKVMAVKTITGVSELTKCLQ